MDHILTGQISISGVSQGSVLEPMARHLLQNYSLQWAIVILKPTRFFAESTRFFAQPSRFFH